MAQSLTWTEVANLGHFYWAESVGSFTPDEEWGGEDYGRYTSDFKVIWHGRN